MIECESANLRNLIELVDVAVDVRPITHVPETGNENRYQKMVPVFQCKFFVPVASGIKIGSPSSRYSRHDRRVRCICYYETRPFLLLAHKRPSPFFYIYPHKKTVFYTDK